MLWAMLLAAAVTAIKAPPGARLRLTTIVFAATGAVWLLAATALDVARGAGLLTLMTSGRIVLSVGLLVLAAGRIEPQRDVLALIGVFLNLAGGLMLVRASPKPD